MGKEIARTTFVQEINSSKLFSTRNQVSFRSKVSCNKGNTDPSLQNHVRSNAERMYMLIQIPKYHEIHIINIQKGVNVKCHVQETGLVIILLKHAMFIKILL